MAKQMTKHVYKKCDIRINRDSPGWWHVRIDGYGWCSEVYAQGTKSEALAEARQTIDERLTAEASKQDSWTV